MKRRKNSGTLEPFCFCCSKDLISEILKGNIKVLGNSVDVLTSKEVELLSVALLRHNVIVIEYSMRIKLTIVETLLVK